MLSPCQRQIKGADAMQRRRFTGCARYMQPIFAQACLCMLCCVAVAHTEGSCYLFQIPNNSFVLEPALLWRDPVAIGSLVARVSLWGR